MQAKVIRFPKKRVRRGEPQTLADAMTQAINALNHSCTVNDLIDWIQLNVHHRNWSPATMRTYFYSFSKPQRFERTERGHYVNTEAFRAPRAARHA